jgi:O-antigen/teichoic acid export membrane protein
MSQQFAQSKWALIESGLSVAMPAVSLLLMARLLQPTDYGVYGVAWAVLAPLWILVECFFSDYLLLQAAAPGPSPGADPFVRAAYGWTLLGTAVLVALLLALGPALLPTSDPDTLHVYQALSVSLLLPALYSVPQALVFRAAHFKVLALRTVGGRVLALVVGGGLAWQGAGVWALVAIQLINGLVSVLATWALPLGRVRPSLATAPLAGHWAFILKINLNNGLSMYSRRVFLLVAASQASLDTVGRMEMASRVVDMINSVFTGFAKRLALPLFMKRGTDPAQLVAQYWRLTLLTTAVSLLAYSPLVACGPWIFETFLGAKWQGAGVLVVYLSVAAGLQAWRYYSFDLANMQGKPGVNLAGQVLSLGMFLLAAQTIQGDSLSALGLAWLLANLGIVVGSSVVFHYTRTLRHWQGGRPTALLLVLSLGSALAVHHWGPQAGWAALASMLLMLVLHTAYSWALALPEWRALRQGMAQ